MISGGSLVRKDVPPFIKAARNPLAYVGVNSIGLKRRGYTAEDINVIHEAYRRLYLKGLNNSAAVQVIRDEVEDTAAREQILAFIDASDRGLIKGQS
jgi:UDP-N-acetylglucosamine acyltransferase